MPIPKPSALAISGAVLAIINYSIIGPPKTDKVLSVPLTPKKTVVRVFLNSWNASFISRKNVIVRAICQEIAVEHGFAIRTC